MTIGAVRVLHTVQLKHQDADIMVFPATKTKIHWAKEEMRKQAEGVR